MVPSSVDIDIQHCRVSQSETSTRTIGDVNICDALVSGDQNVTSPVFYVIVRLRVIWIFIQYIY